jgi:hypothetical protein
MCCALTTIPPPDQVTPDTLLRLGIAAMIAFPDGGSMTAAAVRHIRVVIYKTFSPTAGKIAS